LTLAPNSQQGLKFQNVPVDTFRYNGDGPVEYALIFRIFEGSLIDEQSVYFKCAPRTVFISKVTPDSAGVKSPVKIKGYGFGTSPRDVRVTFSGKEASLDSSSWSDTLITVTVPDNATTGPLQVTAGKMKSNTVPFTITQTSVIEIPISWSSTESPLGEITLETSVKVKVSGQIVDTFATSDGLHQTYTVAPDVPSSIEISAHTTLDKSAITQETINKGKRILMFKQPALLSFLDTEYENFPVQITGEFPRTIQDQSIDFSFTATTNKISISLQFPIYYDQEEYDSLDVLIDRKTNIYYNARTVGIVSVNCRK
jgi:hypothetical protein